MTEVLLGFDARVIPQSPAPLLRERFLLRADVSSLLSIDSSIWPAVVDRVDRPKWIGTNDPFWEDLAKLREHVATIAEPYWIVAATWHKTPFKKRADLPYVGPHETATDPPSRDPAWRFLGYDISDGSISGLSNCGYTVDEMLLLRPVWVPYLNGYHLFDDVDRAVEFRSLADARVPEHAPFFIIGLWLVATRD